MIHFLLLTLGDLNIDRSLFKTDKKIDMLIKYFFILLVYFKKIFSKKLDILKVLFIKKILFNN